MIKEIETVDDIRVFARQLITEDVSFPPSDDFKDI